MNLPSTAAVTGMATHVHPSDCYCGGRALSLQPSALKAFGVDTLAWGSYRGSDTVKAGAHHVHSWQHVLANRQEVPLAIPLNIVQRHLHTETRSNMLVGRASLAGAHIEG